jgi:hypothetical protein
LVITNPEVVVNACLRDCCAEGVQRGFETVRLMEEIQILRRPGIVHACEDGRAALEHPRAVRLMEHPSQEAIEDEAAEERVARHPRLLGGDLCA